MALSGSPHPNTQGRLVSIPESYTLLCLNQLPRDGEHLAADLRSREITFGPNALPMTSFMNANLPSDDEEDEDFQPDERDEEGAAKGRRKPKRMRGAAAGAGAEAGEEAEPADGGRKGDEYLALDAIPMDRRGVEKKAKVDALWSQLNQRAAPAAKAPVGTAGAAAKPGLKQGSSKGDEVRCWSEPPPPCQSAFVASSA